MYAELYTNHFLNLRCSRATFLAFVAYTVAALEKTTSAPLKALAKPLREHYEALSGAVVGRQQQDGNSQGLTRSRRELLDLMRQFVRDLNAEVLVPKYRRTPAVLAELLPGGLTAFNEATNDEMPVRFEAFTQALEAGARVAELGAEPGQQARQLLGELTEATRLKNEGTKQQRETIGAIGGQWTQLCQDLWQVHCRALAEYSAAPGQAWAYFNYALLPPRNPQRRDGNVPARPAA